MSEQPPEKDATLSRRRLLKTAVAGSVGLHLSGAAARAPDPRKAPPAPGDYLVFPSWEHEYRVVTLNDVPFNGPPRLTYPADPATDTIKEKSRLNQILLVRFDEGELSPETSAAAVNGVVAYSGVCTHTGCSVTEWDSEVKNFLCPCHASQFDPRNGAQIIGGPAQRPLPQLPITLENDRLIVAAPFDGKVGAKKKRTF